MTDADKKDRAKARRRSRKMRIDSQSERRLQKELFTGDAQKNAFLGTEFFVPARPRPELENPEQ